MKLRRAQTLVLHWQRGGLVLENYVTRQQVPASPLLLSMLDRASEWQTRERLAHAVAPGDPPAGRRLLRVLERLSLVESAERPARSPHLWHGWLPHAGLLHFGTRNETYATAAAAARDLRRRARAIRPPRPTKSYRGVARIRLPAPASLDASLEGSLLARRTWRRFGRAPVSLRELATLLALTWGVQRWAIDDLGLRVALKTSPSGGAMHPVEVYIAAFRVEGLTPGVYHYDAARHRLSRVCRAPADFSPSRYLPSQTWSAGAAALFLMTAVVARERWKYDSPRAYRAMTLDAGHLCQTFCLVATALDLAPFCSMALADSAVERDAGVDGVAEIALYAAGVGRKPRP